MNATNEMLPESIRKRMRGLREESFGEPTDFDQPNQRARTPSEVERLFNRFLKQWKAETLVLSDAVKIHFHPAHLRIIGLGTDVLPFIFKNLAGGGGPWFVALESITLENPVRPESKGNISLMRSDWLKWGRDHDYLTA